MQQSWDLFNFMQISSDAVPTNESEDKVHSEVKVPLLCFLMCNKAVCEGKKTAKF